MSKLIVPHYTYIRLAIGLVTTHNHKHEYCLVNRSNAKMPKEFSLWHFCDDLYIF